MNWRFPAVATAAITAAAITTAAVVPAQASITPGWRITESYKESPVADIATTGTANAFAVGATGTSGSDSDAAVRHWNGSTWTSVTVPAAFRTGRDEAIGWKAASTSKTDAWVDMMVVSGSDTYDSYLAHYTGSGWNKQTELPKDTYVESLVAVNARDYWAFTVNDSGYATYHYTGSTWLKVSAAPDAFAATDAAGTLWTIGISTSTGAMAIQHLAGTKWVASKLPAGVGSTGYPVAIAAASAKSIWALAAPSDGGTVLLHYNGSVWSKVTVPYSIDEAEGALTPDGGNGAWFVVVNDAFGATSTTDYVYHYNGKWTRTALPGSEGEILSVTRIPGTTSVWAGGLEDNSSHTGLILKYGV